MTVDRCHSCNMCRSRDAEIDSEYTSVKFDVEIIDEIWLSSVPGNTVVDIGREYDGYDDGSSSNEEDSGDFGSAKAHNLIRSTRLE